MTIAINENKTYGVLHSENYFSFFGFSKKINSEEIQKVDIFLDNQLIDTIIANESVEEIEDIYEIQNFSFKYDLAQKYIGKKHTISFKNHSTQENLQNSPYTLIDSENPKFNEYTFLHSLVTINPDEIKNIYCPNSIGFLATKENYDNKNFIQYIENLKLTIPEPKFIGFTFEDKILDFYNSNLTTNIEIKKISNIEDIVKNCSIFIFAKANFDKNIISYFIENSQNIFLVNYVEERINKSIYEIAQLPSYVKLKDFLIQEFNLTNNDNFFLVFKELLKLKLNLDYNFEISDTTELLIEKNIKLALTNKNFINFMYEFLKMAIKNVK